MGQKFLRPFVPGQIHDAPQRLMSYYLAMLAVMSAAASGDAAATVVPERGGQWLAETKTDDDPQSIAMRLVLWKRLGRPAEEWEPLARRINERQNADGGWSQAKGM